MPTRRGSGGGKSAGLGGERNTSMALWGLWISGFLIAALPHVYSQLTWTPIYVSSHSQVDLWTQSDTGCSCSFNASSQDCACCVPSGGCSCGSSMPHRCVQCGLEKHCANMCNITLDSKELFSKSDRGFGQIKSPSLEGPTVCTYKFIPDNGQRVELQIYRLVSVGHHNGTACVGGWLQLEGGARVCGPNERFEQPVVLFSDKPETTLYMQINQNTARSQFLAYFSFASKSSTSVGWPVKNGNRVNNTECDWVYEDCLHEDCVLASPGYPGLYPPNSRCRYFISSESSVSITIVFTSVLLSYNQCTKDYIAVYTGPTSKSALLKMMCGNEKSTIVHAGSTLLVEFKSGPEVPPYNYNGFLARVSFTEITTEAPTTLAPPSTVEGNKSTGSATNNNARYNNRDLNDPRKDEGSSSIPSCDLEASGEQVRSGHHDTRRKLKSTTCRFVLRGRAYDTVHVALASYNLSATECKSKIEIWEGVVESGGPIVGSAKLLKRICSPAEAAHARDQQSGRADKYIEHERYSSSGRDMTVLLRRASNSPTDEEFMDVSYYFHDERHDGTQQPSTICDVEYYGLSSPSEGWVMHPAHRLFAREGPVKCKQHFIPAANQSVIVTVENSTTQIAKTATCETLCGDSGCRCYTNKSLDAEDHLELVSEAGIVVTCLCGNYQNWLPLRIRSWTPIYIEWSRSSRSSGSSLNFRAAFKFTEDSYCGDYNTTKLEGVVNVAHLVNDTSSNLNDYYQQKCTWILDSRIDRQLTVEVASMQDRPCTAWNLTIHEYKKSGDPVGLRLHTFCSRDRHKNFTLPWKMNTAVVRLQALGRTAPQYVMKWRSDTVIANTHKSGPSPAPNYVSGSSQRRCSSHHPALPLVVVILLVAFTSFNHLTPHDQVTPL